MYCSDGNLKAPFVTSTTNVRRPTPRSDPKFAVSLRLRRLPLLSMNVTSHE